jgi:4'-phosphopantetheinyl transferase
MNANIVKQHQTGLWLADPEALEKKGGLDAYWQFLNQQEQERAERFKLVADRKAFIAAHGLLRECLSKYCSLSPGQWEFDTQARGKPILVNDPNHRLPDLRFSISHTRKLVACLVTIGSDCGVDLERVGHAKAPLALAEKYFSPAEVKNLSQLQEDALDLGFAEIWTLKEAYLKARGVGLSMPLDNFYFEIGREPKKSVSFFPPSDDRNDWIFELVYPKEHYCLAIALKR